MVGRQPILAQWGFEMQRVTVASQTLFSVAAQYLGDATLWTQIATLNGITDPWLQGLVTISLPDSPVLSGGAGGD